MKRFLLIIFSFLLTQSFALPYQGIYTVGGLNPDFLLLQDAFDSLMHNGINGPVVLAIRSGIYSNTMAVLDSVPGNSIQNPIYIQSETGDSADVVFEGFSNNNAVIEIDRSKAVVLRELSIRSLGWSSANALQFLNCNAEVDLVHLTTPNVSNTSNSARLLTVLGGTLHLSNADMTKGFRAIIGNQDSLYASRCIFGDDISSTMYGQHAFVKFYACNFLQNGRGSFDISSCIFDSCCISRSLNIYRNDFLEIFQSKIDDKLYFQCQGNLIFHENFGAGYIEGSSHADTVKMYENNMIGFQQSRFYCNWLLMHDNDSGAFVITPQGGIVENNRVRTLGVSSRGAYLLVRNNEVSENLYVDGDSVEVFIENNRALQLRIYQGDSILMRGNEIGSFEMLQVKLGIVYNNWFFKDVSFLFTDKVYFLHNNVIDPQLEFLYYNSVECKNNNLAGPAYSPFGSVMSDYNNYFPFGGTSEVHSLHVDPMYPDSAHLRNTNPLLAGAGAHLSNIVPFDKDELTRNASPTIGAHELCVGSGYYRDTIHVMCGLPQHLSLCAVNNQATCSWSPASGLSSINSFDPLVTVSTPVTYVASIYNASTLIARDTIVVIPDSIFLNAGPDVYQMDCGISTQLSCTWFPGATYSWSPSVYLDDSSSAFPICKPERNTIYTVTCTVPGCGTVSDQIEVTVDTVPYAYLMLSFYHTNEVVFNSNYSRCADNYFWDFGDSSFSILENPTHIYSDTGSYTVVLIVCNAFTCDTALAVIHIDTLPVILEAPEILHQFDDVKISPNPGSGKLQVKLNSFINGNFRMECRSMQGELVKEKSVSITRGQNQIYFDCSDLMDGLYLIRISNSGDQYFQKFIILH